MNNLNIAFISHGGGPMPLFNDTAHSEMISYLKSLAASLPKPNAILVISAHWEENEVRITASAKPPMIYDYYGFPDIAYQIKYPSPGEPELAEKVQQALQKADIPVKMDHQRGYDHGVYVPLTLMYPDADIPTIQLSLVNTLDAEEHIAIGKALQVLDYDNLLVVGSGFTFHNMNAFKTLNSEKNRQDSKLKNEQFEDWLQVTLGDKTLSESERNKQLIEWNKAPHARYCHPREEHLLPLQVCYGLAERTSDEHQSVTIMNKKSSSFVWRSEPKNS
jgi:aromatic ring-opening dioxygenase catalytic subunit (LigB family)